ncbi:hypothetical protein Isop_2605 [Isosphaera pallida ATCC 43644]|uniref:Uncharacterized protein n=1 Tax=Isosphaera pallida (strain ATCC 43644 / DSM 9630 / IS1B) TaxID=575540 RepID=E8QZ33_ISOPI|nr:hypothetical protein Isop_2605 [Isosphaera pallida ATCC 43644]
MVLLLASRSVWITTTEGDGTVAKTHLWIVRRGRSRTTHGWGLGMSERIPSRISPQRQRHTQLNRTRISSMTDRSGNWGRRRQSQTTTHLIISRNAHHGRPNCDGRVSTSTLNAGLELHDGGGAVLHHDGMLGRPLDRCDRLGDNPGPRLYHRGGAGDVDGDGPGHHAKVESHLPWFHSEEQNG